MLCKFGGSTKSPGWKPLHYLGISIGHTFVGPSKDLLEKVLPTRTWPWHIQGDLPVVLPRVKGVEGAPQRRLLRFFFRWRQGGWADGKRGMGGRMTLTKCQVSL